MHHGLDHRVFHRGERGVAIILSPVTIGAYDTAKKILSTSDNGITTTISRRFVSIDLTFKLNKVKKALSKIRTNIINSFI